MPCSLTCSGPRIPNKPSQWSDPSSPAVSVVVHDNINNILQVKGMDDIRRRCLDEPSLIFHGFPLCNIAVRAIP